MTRVRVMRSDIDHPTTARENRSMTIARYSQPSFVHMYVISATQALFGSAGVKSRLSRFSATGKLWFELVVALNLRIVLAFRPSFLIRRATRLRPQRVPRRRSSWWILGLPYSPLLSWWISLITSDSALSSAFLWLSGLRSQA